MLWGMGACELRGPGGKGVLAFQTQEGAGDVGLATQGERRHTYTHPACLYNHCLITSNEPLHPPPLPLPPHPQGVSTHIKLKAAGELQASGRREVFFEANGVPRVVEVSDTRAADAAGRKAIREKVRARGVGGGVVVGRCQTQGQFY